MLPGVTDARLGRLIRALRIRRGLRQADLAAAAGVSRAVVWRLERGALEACTVRALRRVAAALDLTVDLTGRWRGGEADRLVDAGHASLVEAVVRELEGLAPWIAAPEVSFAIYGERGSIDILAWHPELRHLLVVEVKTALTDLQALTSGVDRKRRLARKIALERGWDARLVSVWVVAGDTTSNRRRLAAHRATLRAAFPDEGRTVRAWLRRPDRPLAALSFLPYAPDRSVKSSVTMRVRRTIPSVTKSRA